MYLGKKVSYVRDIRRSQSSIFTLRVTVKDLILIKYRTSESKFKS